MDTTLRQIKRIINSFVNVGRGSRFDIDKGYQRGGFRGSYTSREQRRRFPNKNPRNTQDRRYQYSSQDNNNHTRDCKCDACGCSARYLHKLLNDLRIGDPKQYFLHRPAYINGKDMREILRQCSLKNKDRNAMFAKSRLEMAPQPPTIPIVNLENIDVIPEYTSIESDIVP